MGRIGNDSNNNGNAQFACRDENPSSYDRRKEAEDFEKTKLGVKGLLDAGITQIPRIFHYPPETLAELQQAASNEHEHIIPIIDMSGEDPDVVGKIRDAATKFGFFQVINHGIPVSLLDRVLDAVKATHENLPAEEKVGRYRRDIVTADSGFGFYSNHDLFTFKAASWRDTLTAWLGPTPINPEEVPDLCRSEVMEWDKEVKQLGGRLVGMLCQGLGLSADRMTGDAYLGKVAMIGHYYPPCPEPTKTVGLASHTDLGILTVLLQDQVGGLQVKHDGKWINMKPVQGGLVINIGDLFQILSNDKYVSGEHRVLANASQRPRISVGTFFSPGTDDNLYGPLPELVSPETPALYKQLKYSDLQKDILTKESNCKSMANYFRL